VSAPFKRWVVLSSPGDPAEQTRISQLAHPMVVSPMVQKEINISEISFIEWDSMIKKLSL